MSNVVLFNDINKKITVHKIYRLDGTLLDVDEDFNIVSRIAECVRDHIDNGFTYIVEEVTVREYKEMRDGLVIRM